MARILVIFLVLILTGCASTKVNYGSMVSERLQPKDANAEILLMTKDLDKPYKEIGIISVRGASRDTSYDELNDKLRQKAREVGADAVIKIEYGTEAKNVMMPSTYGYGSMGTTVHKPSCKGIAVIYK
jgi:hypothetical protein